MTTAVPPTAPTISEEDFTQWRENPVTRWVFAALTRSADQNEHNFKAAAWAGRFDIIEQTKKHALADAQRGLAGITYDQALGANGEDQ